MATCKEQSPYRKAVYDFLSRERFLLSNKQKGELSKLLKDTEEKKVTVGSEPTRFTYICRKCRGEKVTIGSRRRKSFHRRHGKKSDFKKI